MQTLTLTTPEEFCFEECLTYLRRSTLECMHRVQGNVLKKAVKLDDALVIFEVTDQPAAKQLRVCYHVVHPCPAAGIENKLKVYLTDVFDLETDLKPYYQLAAGDPLLSQVVQRHYGLRLMGIPDLFEALCWAITGQQINLSFAYRLKQRFVMQFGETVTHQDQTFHLFPNSATIAHLSVADLTPLQFSARKAAYLIGVAQAIQEGVLSKDQLQHLPFEEATETLIRCKGVGRWTAHYVILKCLRMPNAFPIDDVGLHHAIKNLLKLEQKPDLATIERLAQPWHGWLAYTTFYLWHTLLYHE